MLEAAPLLQTYAADISRRAADALPPTELHHPADRQQEPQTYFCSMAITVCLHGQYQLQCIVLYSELPHSLLLQPVNLLCGLFVASKPTISRIGIHLMLISLSLKSNADITGPPELDINWSITSMSCTENDNGQY